MLERNVRFTNFNPDVWIQFCVVLLLLREYGKGPFSTLPHSAYRITKAISSVSKWELGCIIWVLRNQ